jgi:hypothetical protein
MGLQKKTRRKKDGMEIRRSELTDYCVIFLDAESGIIYNEMCAPAASLLLHVIQW